MQRPKQIKLVKQLEFLHQLTLFFHHSYQKYDYLFAFSLHQTLQDLLKFLLTHFQSSKILVLTRQLKCVHHMDDKLILIPHKAKHCSACISFLPLPPMSLFHSLLPATLGAL